MQTAFPWPSFLNEPGIKLKNFSFLSPPINLLIQTYDPHCNPLGTPS